MTHARLMAKRNFSNPANPTDLGFDAHVFDNDNVFRLLKAAVRNEGGQTVFRSATGLIVFTSIWF